MLKTGMVIAERYEILSNIGTGGMADVYRSKDLKLNRYVAVKVLKPEFRDDKTFIRKFRSEAQAAAGLTHPNIVSVFDVGDDEGVYYIVMELIEGITLKDYISKKGKLSIKEATSIAIQVSMGLEAAHNHGIVHRDVKPQNIIISTDGKVKVTDFGIARAASSNTISSNVVGSVHYSSPEQVRGGYSDEKSDIYSLGITIYEMVTGKVPFTGDTTVAIAIKHLQEEMVPPSAYTQDIPFSLEQIIYKCTQKSVDRRYQKMEEVIADLKHSLIDPQGDFVKIDTVDKGAKTRVISDEEIGEIQKGGKAKIVPEDEDPDDDPRLAEKREREKERQARKEARKAARAERARKAEQRRLEEDELDEEEERPRRKKKKKRRGTGFGLSILLTLLAVAALVFIIIFIGKQAGLIRDGQETDSQTPVTQTAAVDDGLIEVPDLVGRTEDEARELASEKHLGIQMAGEELSAQQAGRIGRQDPAAGTRVEENSTVKYYISTGASMPDVTAMTGTQAVAALEKLGLTVTVDKQYSESDDYGNALVEPGYVISTTPSAGETISGSSVTVTVSRGLDFGEEALVPNVVGMAEEQAVTTLGKFLDIQVMKEMNTEVEAGYVFSQSIEGDTYADPDQTITIVVSTGAQEPSASAQETQAAASGETWLCNQKINTPEGYVGGLVRLELVQTVNGQPEASVIVDGEQLEFPYQLNIVGAPGVADGTLYVSEQVDGVYQELGHYPITFTKVE